MLNLIMLTDGTYVLIHGTVGKEPTITHGDESYMIEYMDYKGLSSDQMLALLALADSQRPVELITNCTSIS